LSSRKTLREISLVFLKSKHKENKFVAKKKKPYTKYNALKKNAKLK
jgi:hypothetical protein